MNLDVYMKNENQRTFTMKIEEAQYVSGPPGASAYDIAVKNGFEGTEEEWLASLVGVSASPVTIGEIVIAADNWDGEGNVYFQAVSVPGATENSQVDLTPSADQLEIFREKDLAFVTENDSGVVTVYAIGQKPENDYTMQVTITEVLS